MLGRNQQWDYHQRAIYMVTLTTHERRPLLGKLAGGSENARVELSEIGQIVTTCWEKLPEHYPGISLLEWQVMPDHFHGIVFVKEAQTKALGNMVGAFKSHSTSQVLNRFARGTGQNEAPFRTACGTEKLWAPGFQDRILFRKGQLPVMRAYVLDNPRRAAIKRENPELFKVVRNMKLFAQPFAAIGNHFLLDFPEIRQVKCSRRVSTAELSQLEAEHMTAAQHGAVLVSPCISPGEKQMARTALAASHPLIVLLENGFSPLYKPSGAYFQACAEGRLLMLAPWPYHPDKRPITREQCLALNHFAAEIAALSRPRGGASPPAILPLRPVRGACATLPSKTLQKPAVFAPFEIATFPPVVI